MTYFCALYVLRLVHGLAVLKGHPECLKCGKTFFPLAAGAPPRTPLGELTALPQT